MVLSKFVVVWGCILLGGCGTSLPTAQLPVFHANRQWAQTSMEFSSTATRPWIVSVMIPIPPNSTTATLREQLLAFQSITGHDAIPSGIIKPHRGMDLTVNWYRKSVGELELVESRTVNSEYETAIPGGMGMGIGPAVCLPPGHYVVTVTQTRPESRFDGIDFRLFVGNNPLERC
jgi:hypothetical protein